VNAGTDETTITDSKTIWSSIIIIAELF
jgi:hypothetical protein